MHCGYVTTLNNVRKHPNADKLVLATCFVNTVCVNKDMYHEGEIGVYFPVDLQLSMEFCQKNGLLAVYENGINVSGGYMDPAKRNVKAIKLRGEQSDGLFLPLKCLEYTGVDMDSLNIGDTITTVNGHEICRKYIPQSNKRQRTGKKGNKVRKRKDPIAPLFQEHANTEQLGYNLGAFKNGDEIEITLKMHGTSGRVGYLPKLMGYKRTLWDKITRKPGKPIYNWGYVTGTRRVVLDDFEGGFYGSNEFREPHSKIFEGKLWKSETVYFEIVGFTTAGVPIMPPANNLKTNDKEFIKKYGKTTIFSYGCSPTGYNTFPDGSHEVIPQSDIYVYRMTMTNEDGDVVEYTPDFMRYRCEQMGVKCVPVMWRGTIPDEEVFTETTCELTNAGEWVQEKAEEYYDGPDPVDKTHVREGVVVRILNRPKFTAYKHKNFNFKVLSNIAVAQAEANGDTDNMDADRLAEM